MTLEQLPALNASLNFVATCLLLAGFMAIKKKKEVLHKKLMISALCVSALFLSSYLIYHYNVGSQGFPELGAVKVFYLVILIPHIILATLMLPMIAKTFYHAFRDERERHKKWAKWTFPIWLYVSITGVVIYFMLYHLAPVLESLR